MRKTPYEKEWDALVRKETRYLKNNSEKQEFILNRKLEERVPDKLQEKLDLAFYKGFQIVFEKGTGIIEKTYSKEKKAEAHQVDSHALKRSESRKNLRAFSRRSRLANTRNLAISLGEGIATGLPGIGLPDIPLFIGMILKSIYEIALSYGFSYDTDGERIFILRLIRTSLLKGPELETENDAVNRLIQGGIPGSCARDELSDAIRSASDTLSQELIYLKFLQGIPIAGVIGGLSDAVYLKKITAYASLKYYRRFLEEKRSNAF